MQHLRFEYSHCDIVEKDIHEVAKGLHDYLAELRHASQDASFSKPEASVRLPFDMEIRKEAFSLANNLKNEKLKYILVLGIGGSNLGTQAVYEAIHGRHTEFRPVRLFLGDTVTPRLLTYLTKAIIERAQTPEEFVINIISKSGTTTETLANFEVLYQRFVQKFGEPAINSRVVATTDEGSKLWHAAEQKGFHRLPIPANVGGRFSVFSAVGLLPLELVGIQTDELLEGALDMAERCLQPDDNPALISAALTFLHAKKGINIHNSFFFNPELESLGKWYRQLMGESIGKEKGADGREVRAGITPMVSIGSTDLHSMAQLYFGGPRNTLHTIIYGPNSGFDAQVPENPILNLLPFIAGKDVKKIMQAIIGGVQSAYQKNGIPFNEIYFPEIREYYLGQFLQMKMMEMMFLAKLMNLNAFDQPNVEDYKEGTRNLLS